MNSLEKKYHKEIVPQLMKKFNYNNKHAVPQIKKVSLNVRTSQTKNGADYIENVIEDIRAISGQAPIKTRAKKAIAGFKIRQNQEVGVAVSIRGERAWDFIERLISAAVPRIRDFRGIDLKNFDKQGNLNYPIREQLVFPEISHDEIKTIFGMQVNITVKANVRDENIELFKLLGFPLKLEEEGGRLNDNK